MFESNLYEARSCLSQSIKSNECKNLLNDSDLMSSLKTDINQFKIVSEIVEEKNSEIAGLILQKNHLNQLISDFTQGVVASKSHNCKERITHTECMSGENFYFRKVISNELTYTGKVSSSYRFEDDGTAVHFSSSWSNSGNLEQRIGFEKVSCFKLNPECINVKIPDNTGGAQIEVDKALLERSKITDMILALKETVYGYKNSMAEFIGSKNEYFSNTSSNLIEDTLMALKAHLVEEAIKAAEELTLENSYDESKQAAFEEYLDKTDTLHSDLAIEQAHAEL